MKNEIEGLRSKLKDKEHIISWMDDKIKHHETKEEK